MPRKKIPHNRDDYYLTRDLIERGWSRTTICKHIQEPDKYRANAHCLGGGRIKLYHKQRVHDLEATKYVRMDLEMTRRRRDQRRVSRTKKELLQRAKEERFVVPALSYRELCGWATEYESRQSDIPGTGGVRICLPMEVADPRVHRRIIKFALSSVVNYRNIVKRVIDAPNGGTDSEPSPCVKYDMKTVETIRPELERIVQSRILRVLAIRYPELADECERQIQQLSPGVE